MGTKSLRGPKRGGEIFANYLILTGVARFLIEFIRIRSLVFRDVQRAKRELAVYPGWRGVTLAYQKPISPLKKEHRIVEHIAARGDVLQPEYHKTTPECPHPERWHMYDSMTAEVEVLISSKRS